MTATPLPPDELDRAFGGFLKAQLPARWPAAPATPTAEPNRPAAAAGVSRSRLTLAASVAALLGLGLYLSSGPRTAPVAENRKSDGLSVKDSTADGSKLFQHTKPTGKP